MNEISILVDRILESDDYVMVLRETKNYNVKTFEEFVNVLKDFDERVKKQGIETSLTVNEPSNDNKDALLTWFVDQGYMNDKDRTFSVISFDKGKVSCDKTKRFRVPGSTNLNELVDVNQILKLIDGYVYSLEREDPKGGSSGEDNKEKPDEEKTREEKEDEAYVMDDSLKTALDSVKKKGEELAGKFKSSKPFEYNGKTYKIEDVKLLASTEEELVLSILYSRSDEMDIYETGTDGKKLRSAMLRHYNKLGFGKQAPEFRLDMNKDPYFYSVVGKLPVKKTSGPEARAILNYFDGKVRFQPKEKD